MTRTRRIPRVLMVTFEYGPIQHGGLGSVVTALCGAMDRTRIEPVVVLPRSDCRAQWPLGEARASSCCDIDIRRIEGVEVWLLSNPILDRQPIYPRTPAGRREKIDSFGDCVGALIEAMDIDVVHLHDSFGHRCLEAAQRARKPVIYTVHKLHRDLPDEFAAEKRCAGLADVVTTVGRSYAGESADFFDPSRIRWIANGIDPEYWSFGSERELVAVREDRRRALLASFGLRDRVTFAYVGRLDANQKGLDVLLETYRHRIPLHDSNLIVVGDGSPALASELSALAESAPERIRFVGRAAPRSEVRELLGAVDFVVLPSRFEPFGLVQIEAMAVGALPIASATGGHKDVIVDMGHEGGFGRLFPPGDAPGLGRAIEEMARLRRERPDRVNEMRVRAAATAHRYSDRAMARRYEELYASVLNPDEQ